MHIGGRPSEAHRRIHGREGLARRKRDRVRLPGRNADDLAARHGQQADNGDRKDDAYPLRPAQRAVEHVDADEARGDGEGQLPKRREQGGRAPEALLVEAERSEACDEREHRDPEAVVCAGVCRRRDDG